MAEQGEHVQLGWRKAKPLRKKGREADEESERPGNVRAKGGIVAQQRWGEGLDHKGIGAKGGIEKKKNPVRCRVSKIGVDPRTVPVEKGNENYGPWFATRPLGSADPMGGEKWSKNELRGRGGEKVRRTRDR